MCYPPSPPTNFNHHVHRACRFPSPRLTAHIYPASECHCERSIPHIEDDTVVVAQWLSTYTPGTSWRWRPPREQTSLTAPSLLRSNVDPPGASAYLLPHYYSTHYYAEAPYKHAFYSGDAACIDMSTFSWLPHCLKMPSVQDLVPSNPLTYSFRAVTKRPRDSYPLSR